MFAPALVAASVPLTAAGAGAPQPPHGGVGKATTMLIAATAANVLQIAVAIAALMALPVGALAWGFKRFITSIDRLSVAVQRMNEQQIRHDGQIAALKAMEERHHHDNQAILRELAKRQ